MMYLGMVLMRKKWRGILGDSIMVSECVDCPKKYYLKLFPLCPFRDYPYDHAKLKYKDVDCNCVERMKLIKKMGREN